MNLPWKPDSSDDALAELRKRALPREPFKTREDTARWAKFTRGLASFYQRYIRGWTWEQIDRLREAKLREIESANEERSAAALAKIAEARKLDAEAELAFYEVESKRVELAEKHRAALQLGQTASSNEPSKEQWDELRRAIESIELKGGKVVLPEAIQVALQTQQEGIDPGQVE